MILQRTCWGPAFSHKRARSGENRLPQNDLWRYVGEILAGGAMHGPAYHPHLRWRCLRLPRV
jgi:hypothetical protein